MCPLSRTRVVNEFRTRFYDTNLLGDRYAGSKFAQYLFRRHEVPAEGAHAGSGSPHRGRSAAVYRGGARRPRHHCRTAQQATVMELQRIGIKLFADSSAPVPVREFIPVFHSWIQKQAIENHLLIDVHNYSHIHNGPGILLVAQEGNFSIDLADGRMGLLYYRKKSGDGFASVLKTALRRLQASGVGSRTRWTASIPHGRNADCHERSPARSKQRSDFRRVETFS